MCSVNALMLMLMLMLLYRLDGLNQLDKPESWKRIWEGRKEDLVKGKRSN